MKTNTCVDCGTLISDKSMRCNKCFGKNNHGKNNPNYRGGIIICPECGKRKSAQAKVCQNCYFKNRRGKNNPAWRGGVSDYRGGGARNTISLEYANWRFQIFERDDFRCKHCGDKKGGNLRAHHIQNFSEHKELRLEISNGITLCNSCHNLFHSLFGKKGNNLGQLNWFFENVKLNKTLKE